MRSLLLNFRRDGVIELLYYNDLSNVQIQYGWISSITHLIRLLSLGSNSSSAATHLSRFCVGRLNDYGSPGKGDFFSEKNWDDTIVRSPDITPSKSDTIVN